MTHTLTGLLIQVRARGLSIHIRCEHLPRHHLPLRQPDQELVVGNGMPPGLHHCHPLLDLLNQLEAIFTEFQERALTRRDQLVDYEMKRTMVSSDKD